MLDFLKKFSLLFTKGGLLSWFYPLYEGTFTFLYSSGRVTTGRTHVRDFSDLKRIMIIVWAAVFLLCSMVGTTLVTKPLWQLLHCQMHRKLQLLATAY